MREKVTKSISKNCYASFFSLPFYYLGKQGHKMLDQAPSPILQPQKHKIKQSATSPTFRKSPSRIVCWLISILKYMFVGSDSLDY